MTDKINPDYYKGKNMEAQDVIEAFNLLYTEGVIIKYILRWREKNGVEDLRKARWYLNRLINKKELDSASNSIQFTDMDL